MQGGPLGWFGVVRERHELFPREDDEEGRSPATERVPSDLPARGREADIGVVVSVRVCVRRERRCVVAEVDLTPFLVTQHQGTQRRMQPIGRHDEIEASRGCMFEHDERALAVLADSGDAVAEDRLYLWGNEAVDLACEIAAEQAHEAPVGCRLEATDVEPHDPASLGVDDLELANVIPDTIECRSKAHALGDVVADAPEVDHVAAGSKRRGTLHESRDEAMPQQPVGECWAGNPGPGDEHASIVHTTRSTPRLAPLCPASGAVHAGATCSDCFYPR